MGENNCNIAKLTPNLWQVVQEIRGIKWGEIGECNWYKRGSSTQSNKNTQTNGTGTDLAVLLAEANLIESYPETKYFDPLTWILESTACIPS